MTCPCKVLKNFGIRKDIHSKSHEVYRGHHHSGPYGQCAVCKKPFKAADKKISWTSQGGYTDYMHKNCKEE